MHFEVQVWSSRLSALVLHGPPCAHLHEPAARLLSGTSVVAVSNMWKGLPRMLHCFWVSALDISTSLSSMPGFPVLLAHADDLVVLDERLTMYPLVVA